MSEDYLQLSVKDEGPGIADEEQADLFEAYQVSSNVPLQGESKSGLGLAVVKKIASALAAETGFESERGRGSVNFMSAFRKSAIVNYCADKQHVKSCYLFHLIS